MNSNWEPAQLPSQCESQMAFLSDLKAKAINGNKVAADLLYVLATSAVIDLREVWEKNRAILISLAQTQDAWPVLIGLHPTNFKKYEDVLEHLGKVSPRFNNDKNAKWNIKSPAQQWAAKIHLRIVVRKKAIAVAKAKASGAPLIFDDPFDAEIDILPDRLTKSTAPFWFEVGKKMFLQEGLNINETAEWKDRVKRYKIPKSGGEESYVWGKVKEALITQAPTH